MKIHWTVAVVIKAGTAIAEVAPTPVLPADPSYHSEDFLSLERASSSWHPAVMDAVKDFLPAVEPAEDTDGDGLRDDWEIRYFGNLSDQSGTDDADGDGKTNLAEMSAGTNPMNPSE